MGRKKGSKNKPQEQTQEVKEVPKVEEQTQQNQEPIVEVQSI
jgi:hypothetical protein